MCIFTQMSYVHRYVHTFSNGLLGLAMLSDTRGAKSENEHNPSSVKKRAPPAFLASIRKTGGDVNNADKVTKPSVLNSINKFKKAEINKVKVQKEIVVNKKKIVPNKKMKALHWKRKIIPMTNKDESKQEKDMVWNNVDEIKFNMDESYTYESMYK